MRSKVEIIEEEPSWSSPKDLTPVLIILHISRTNYSAYCYTSYFLRDDYWSPINLLHVSSLHRLFAASAVDRHGVLCAGWLNDRANRRCPSVLTSNIRCAISRLPAVVVTTH
ncbi:hypothetical protein ACI65C_001706 [Semiaphis heraclei]